MSIFDIAQIALHDTTTDIFGEPASWTPALGGATEVEQVNFNRPDKDKNIGEYSAKDFEYGPQGAWMEYRKGQFTALADSVKNGTLESVVILTITYQVTEVTAHWDGKTFIGTLQEAA